MIPERVVKQAYYRRVLLICVILYSLGVCMIWAWEVFSDKGDMMRALRASAEDAARRFMYGSWQIAWQGDKARKKME